MESSQNFGGTEDCHSSESGWTMYIGSPMLDDDDDDDGGDDSDEHSDDADDNTDASTDDSMASDASSGPSQREHHCWDDECGRSMIQYKHDDDEDGCKCSTHHEVENLVKNETHERRREKKEAPVPMAQRTTATTTSTTVQSGFKVRRKNKKAK